MRPHRVRGGAREVCVFLLFVACKPETPTVAVEPLPEIWGPATAEDFDPDPDVVEVHLTAEEADFDLIDGGTTELWTYNGQFPGPLIHARVGDTLRVVFDNALPEDETTIHWHGLRIPDDQDGVPAMMDPVQPGESFTYEFTLPDIGSYWYHPHVRSNEQVERGLYGQIVVSEEEPPAVDRDRYFAVDDIYLKDGGAVEGGFDDLQNMTGVHGRFGNYLVVNGSTDLLTDTIRPGAVERWRLVSTANARVVDFRVRNADWRIVGTDGGLLPEPYEDSRERLPPGQRYELEVTPEAGASEVTLELRVGSEEIPIFTATVEGDPMDAREVEWPERELPAIEEALQEVTLDLDGSTASGELVWTVNGEAYDGEEMNAVMVESGVPTRITIVEHSGADHPFHLHGNFFQIVARDGEAADDEPGFKDTVLVKGDETVELYTGFENPGRWMGHCHILEHAELGMMTEIVAE